jgi:hypothetical protein
VTGAGRGAGGQPEDEPEHEREHEPEAEPEVVLRPEAVVLGDEALVPAANLVRPPPNHFTHELTVDEPYRFDRPGGGQSGHDGVLHAGTPVMLLVEGDDTCRVVDGSGLYVAVRCSSLRALARPG